MKSKCMSKELLKTESPRTKSWKSFCRSRSIAEFRPLSTASESPERYSRSSAMADRKVGFVGIGRMGGRLAHRLIAAGFELTIFDTNEQIVRSFVELGAHSAASPAAVASACEIVITCLPTPSVVHAVALGP